MPPLKVLLSITKVTSWGTRFVLRFLMGVAERQLITGNLALVSDVDKWAIGPGRDCGIIYALSYLICFL
jgi:hypothetical protein